MIGSEHPRRRGAARRGVVAVTYGLVCHGLFALAVATMAAGVATGLRTGRGTLTGPVAFAANLGLVLQFPLLHSFLLTRRGRALLAHLAPAAIGRDLAATTYVIVASLQLLATFSAWSPTGVLWWQPTGAAAALVWTAHAAAWLYLLLALWHGGLALQSGAIGWWSVLRGVRPDHGPLPTRGTFARCRHPIYLAFALILLTAPAWTPDRLLLVVPWTAYCVLGPLHKERRLQRVHGRAFVDYRAAVPYLLPWRRP